MFAVGWGANQFTSLLLAYKLHRHLSAGTGDALFGVYALGLIPALLILGPISDRHGRRTITCGAGVLSGIATVLLIAGDHGTILLAAGRLVSGICSGAAFAAGTAWVKELSSPPHDLGAGAQSGARRAAAALSAGFALGPLAAGLLAQWAPDPLVVAYLPHLLVIALVLGPGFLTPETVAPGRQEMRRSVLTSGAGPRFRAVLMPAAPWVFIAPSVAFATVPALLGGHLGSFRVGFAGLTAALTLSVGIAVQPAASRLNARHSGRGLSVGLLTALVGMLVAALAVIAGSWPVALLADILLGASYGLCLVSGLFEVQTLAAPHDLASLTAIFYALTYVGFASPLVIAELQKVMSGSTALLCGAGLAALVLTTVSRALSA